MFRKFQKLMFGCLPICLILSCNFSQDPDEVATQNYVDYVNIHRNEMQSYFKSDDSPLPPDKRKHFIGIDYYPVHERYRVTAQFTPIADGEVFRMAATGKEADVYQTAGTVTFTLDSINCTLEIYKNITLQAEQGKHAYFIPFYDRTNGVETYSGGRYLDVVIPDAQQLILDFNLTYQPYCYYNSAYSCPIPPLNNRLPLHVRAGEKM